jgi:short-subunit dehydrogenase
MSSCIITGTSEGIGRAAAIELSKRGYFDIIVLIARNKAKLDETIKCMDPSQISTGIVFDLMKLSAIPELIREINTKYGSIGCLLNIAGYADPQPLFNCSIKNIEQTYKVNVFAPLILMRECARFMKNNNFISKIINIGSTAGISARPGWVAYASSKAAIVSISSTLSEELQEYNIKSYCLSPGRCATRLRRKLAPEEDQSLIMQPETVGAIIGDLADPDEKYLDGQNIIVRKK